MISVGAWAGGLGLLFCCLSLTISMPRRRSAAAGFPSRINLDVAGGLTQAVASRRESLCLEFERWVEAELWCSFQQVSKSGLLLGTALIGYGKAFFYSGGPKYVFSETLNAVVDRFNHFRPSGPLARRGADRTIYGDARGCFPSCSGCSLFVAVATFCCGPSSGLPRVVETGRADFSSA